MGKPRIKKILELAAPSNKIKDTKEILHYAGIKQILKGETILNSKEIYSKLSGKTYEYGDVTIKEPIFKNRAQLVRDFHDLERVGVVEHISRGRYKICFPFLTETIRIKDASNLETYPLNQIIPERYHNYGVDGPYDIIYDEERPLYDDVYITIYGFDKKSFTENEKECVDEIEKALSTLISIKEKKIRKEWKATLDKEIKKIKDKETIRFLKKESRYILKQILYGERYNKKKIKGLIDYCCIRSVSEDSKPTYKFTHEQKERIISIIEKLKKAIMNFKTPSISIVGRASAYLATIRGG